MPLDLGERYVLLQPDGRTIVVEADAFWADVQGGRKADEREVLVGIFTNETTWPTAEMHPIGDEPVLLLDGAVDLLLDPGGRDEMLRLEPGLTCVVPHGTWHRGVVREPGRTLHLTCGAGTEVRPEPATLPAAPAASDQPRLDLDATWLHLHERRATPIARADCEGGARGWLAGTTRTAQSDTSWALHPDGDTLVCAISGDFEVALDDGAASRSSQQPLRLDAGKALVVPKSVWHRVDVRTPGRLLRVAFGGQPHTRPV